MGKIKKTGGGLTAAVLGALLLPAAAFAQTAEKLDVLLGTERVSFAQAAAIILPAAGILPPEAGEEEAFSYASAWFPRRAEQNVPIKMGELSHLVMQSFSLSGGFMYALFPGPRYAYRALAWRRLLPLNADPGRFLNGEDLLYITSQVLSLAGEAEPLAAAAPPALREEASVLEETPAQETENRLEVEQGQGLSSGPEEVLPYRGEFEVE
jgi:hypothetical protein